MIKIDSSFHPLMFCFAGYSGTGKTTLIAKLITELKEFKIGYIKHDAHGFEIDKPGKDTYVIKNSGAEIVMINDNENEAIVSTRSCYNQEKNIFLDSDLLIIEGHKFSQLSKMIIVDDELKIIQDIENGKIALPIAFICTEKTIEYCQRLNIPCFHRDDVQSIGQLIRDKITKEKSIVPVYGLVLCGGLSSRMKQDKGKIQYHGTSQVEFTYNLLKEFCSNVFVSCRKEQGEDEHLKNLPQIHDRFLDCGPLGGILSAMSTHRHAAWLVFACDLPMLNSDIIKRLFQERGALQMGTAFYSINEKRFEPLAAIYEPKSYHRMFYFLAEGKTCPQKVLYNSKIKTIYFNKDDEVEKILINANTPEDYIDACSTLKTRITNENKN